MRILNLYSGLGGNRKNWEGEVTAVEMEQDIADVYKKLFPGDTVIVGDAHEYLLQNYGGFDFIWDSRPCQSHTRMMKFTRHKLKHYPDMGLYEEIIFLQHFFKGKWIVENVKPYYEPLIKPTSIIGRHYLWSNFTITDFHLPACPDFIMNNTVAGSEQLKEWLGIKYEGNIYYRGNHSPSQVLRNCVHPDLGLHILNCAIGKIVSEKIVQESLFNQTT